MLAAAYLKYRRCRLSCLPFVWHFFSLWHTRMHARTLHTCTLSTTSHLCLRKYSLVLAIGSFVVPFVLPLMRWGRKSDYGKNEIRLLCLCLFVCFTLNFSCRANWPTKLTHQSLQKKKKKLNKKRKETEAASNCLPARPPCHPLILNDRVIWWLGSSTDPCSWSFHSRMGFLFIISL